MTSSWPRTVSTRTLFYWVNKLIRDDWSTLSHQDRSALVFGKSRVSAAVSHLVALGRCGRDASDWHGADGWRSDFERVVREDRWGFDYTRITCPVVMVSASDAYAPMNVGHAFELFSGSPSVRVLELDHVGHIDIAPMTDDVLTLAAAAARYSPSIGSAHWIEQLATSTSVLHTRTGSGLVLDETFESRSTSAGVLPPSSLLERQAMCAVPDLYLPD
jgi:hypothetical protein